MIIAVRRTLPLVRTFSNIRRTRDPLSVNRTTRLPGTRDRSTRPALVSHIRPPGRPDHTAFGPRRAAPYSVGDVVARARSQFHVILRHWGRTHIAPKLARSGGET